MEIAYCDLTPAFAAHPEPASLFLPGDSVHFTVAGHALARDAILDCASQGRLPLFRSARSHSTPAAPSDPAEG